MRSGLFRTLVLGAAVACACGSWAADARRAKEILDQGGLGGGGGLVVHLGCGDGRLTAALRAGDHGVVHGLDADAANVAAARRHVASLGLYGPVSVERFDGKRLPYADNVVNLLVVSNPFAVERGELLRVLCPGGAALRVAAGDGAVAAEKLVKPWPGNIDQWTHYRHDASGNAVARDELVGPPARLQWTAEPPHTRSHEHIPSLCALVSSAGRIFYLVDEAPIASLRYPPRWQLVARDAFNGLPLWKRPVGAWFPHMVNWGQTPPQLQRRLVAVEDRVFVTLGLHAPLSALDAATGEPLKQFEDTLGTEEVLWHEGILVLAVREVGDERKAELARWARWVAEDKSPLHARETAEPFVKRLRAVEATGRRAVVALEAASGRLLWKRDGPTVAALRTESLCAGGQRVFYQSGREVVCLDLHGGEPQWSAPAPPLRLVHEGRVFCASGETAAALSATTGQTQWTQPTSLCDVHDVFVAGGSLWLGGFKPFEGKTKGRRGPSWGPYCLTELDPATGKMLRHLVPDNPGHHHRCYANKATDRYILAGRRGTEFIDLASGEVLWHSWARGVCRYGVLPANGLLYVPPHACACYVAARLIGFNALAAADQTDTRAAPAEDRPPLERGPAYSAPAHPPSPIPHPQSPIPHPSDWPTYRADAQRSGSTREPVPPRVRRAWQSALGPRITAPTIAQGRVLAAVVDEHQVCALDADTGRAAWSFTAGARVDSPPTIHQGTALFGCRDGHVYCLRLADGALIWRLRAARHDRLITADGQLESAWPVHGSVLVQDGVAYVTAGRSSYLDGGIDLCRVEPATGKLLSRTPIHSPDPATGRQPPQSSPATMPGARADILSADGQYIYLRDMVFDARGNAAAQGAPHLFTLTGFLDHSWAHRSYWIFGTRCSIATGCSSRDKDLLFGRLLVFDESTVYGYGRASVHWSDQFQDGPYRLFARRRGEPAPAWTKAVPIQVSAMLLADKVLFVACSPSKVLGQEEKDSAAVLLALSAHDGSVLAQCPLDGPPLGDGMGAAGGRLYVALACGRMVCMGPTEPIPSQFRGHNTYFGSSEGCRPNLSHLAIIGIVSPELRFDTFRLGSTSSPTMERTR